MSQIIFSPAALRDLERLRHFLRSKSPAAARRAATAIIQSVQVLRQQPQIGRPVESLPETYRDWIVEFGDSGYVVRYRYDEKIVTIVAIRHQKEAGYSSDR